MKNFNYKTNHYTGVSHTHYDEGLRQYFLKIYTLMSSGLFITALSAVAVLYVPFLTQLMFNITLENHVVGLTMFGWLVTFAPLGISLYFAFNQNKMTVQNAQMLFWIYASLIGMSLSSLGFIYTEVSIIKTFFICSTMFAAMSLYGYSTKKDLTSIASFLYMGLIGLVIASLVNIFFNSPAIEFALSVIGVFVFTGLIAFDTQKLKALYYQGADCNNTIGIMAAFTLYLDFINLFIYLLRFFGERKDHK